MEGKTVSFKVFEKESVLLTEKDAPIPLLVNKEEKTEVEAKVNDGKAQIAVILKRKDKDAHQQWKDILSPPEECIDGVWYDNKKDQDIKMTDDDARIVAEPDRYTPAIKHQEKKKTYLWLQITCEGDQLDFDQPFLKKSGALEVDYSDRAPWMVFAIKEYETYKGINEDESSLKERIIKDYHMSTTYAPAHYGTDDQWTQRTPWCASFVNWCFNQIKEYKGTNTKGNGSAFDWAPVGSSKTKPKKGIDGWANGEKCEPFVGAVIVLKYSHCAFIVGKNSKKNKYVYLGGNQGGENNGEQQIKFGTVTIGKEFSIMKPKNYHIKSRELPELNEDKDGSYNSTR